MNAAMSSPVHAPHGFVVLDNELQLGGKALSQLAAEVGRTPFYAYDTARIRERVAMLRHVLPADIQLHYALKANPMPELAGFLAGLVAGFDTASGGEMRIALGTGMPAQHISLAGPGKTDAELRQAIEAGVLVNLESAGELERLAALGAALGKRPRAAVRINPDFELKSSGMKMGGGAKPFGVDAEQAPALLARLAELPVEFVGFHIFAGSQNLKAESLIEAQHKTLALARRLAAHAPAPIRLLNLGGGFGIPYFPGEQPLDVACVAAALEIGLMQARRDFPEAEFVLELGRYLVGEAGVYVTRVLDRKVSRGQVFLITDGGMNHHLAASGNLGQVLRKNFPVLVGNRVEAASPEIATVCGPLCTPLDVLAEKMPLGHAQVGDLIVVLQSGAYGLSASPTVFLGHPVPVEWLIGEASEIKPRQRVP